MDGQGLPQALNANGSWGSVHDPLRGSGPCPPALLLFHSHGLASSAAPPSTQYLWRPLEDVKMMAEPGAQTKSFILEDSLRLS